MGREILVRRGFRRSFCVGEECKSVDGGDLWLDVGRGTLVQAGLHMSAPEYVGRRPVKVESKSTCMFYSRQVKPLPLGIPSWCHCT